MLLDPIFMTRMHVVRIEFQHRDYPDPVAFDKLIENSPTTLNSTGQVERTLVRVVN
ncbi:MAG: hypothetical protein NPIRA04_05880 [Nitrospirales bacterium]|nr:MAG: hypothetical protein NPIRA04_05880 [Nitrospirales bacterium]